MELKEQEFFALCDVMNGHWWSDDENKFGHSAKSEILPNLEDTLAGNGLIDDLESKWSINGQELVSKIKGATDEECEETKKRIIEWWEKQ